MTSLLLFLSTVSLGFIAIRLYQKKDRLQRLLGRYESLSSREEAEQKLDDAIQAKKYYLQELHSQEEELSSRIERAQSQLVNAEEEMYLQSLGFHEPQYDFLMLEDYKAQFDTIKRERKNLIKQGRAAISWRQWTVGDDARKGKKMIFDYLKVIRSAFDEICDSAINDVKLKSIERLRKRILKSFDNLNKFSRILECEISEEYQQVRLRELDIKYEMELKKQEDSERRKIRQEKLRQEAKERKAMEAALRKQQEAEEREAQYKQELEEQDKRLKFILSQKREENRQEIERLTEQIEHLNQQIHEAEKDIQSARKDYSQIKSGIIYVISSKRSLGANRYRVFMTKNSEPRKYLKSMNPYVPFEFVWHIEAWFEDASDALEEIHKRLEDKRVNKNNLRRDFFDVSLEEIRTAIYDMAKQIKGEIIENEDDSIKF